MYISGPNPIIIVEWAVHIIVPSFFFFFLRGTRFLLLICQSVSQPMLFLPRVHNTTNLILLFITKGFLFFEIKCFYLAIRMYWLLAYIPKLCCICILPIKKRNYAAFFFLPQSCTLICNFVQVLQKRSSKARAPVNRVLESRAGKMRTEKAARKEEINDCLTNTTLNQRLNSLAATAMDINKQMRAIIRLFFN